MSKLEKEVNDFLNLALTGVFISIGKGIRCVFKGVFNLNRWKFIGFVFSVVATIISYNMKNNYYLAVKQFSIPSWMEVIGYCILLLIPIWYLMILGLIQEMEQAECQKQFESVGFKSRDGKTPYLIKKTKDKNGLKESRKHKEVFVFKSNIPFTEWMNAKERIEIALDRNIVRFKLGNSKRVCQIITVPPQYKTPIKVNWDDIKLQKEDGAVVIGETALETITFDLNRTPHVLAAGETGSGKSVILRLLLWQLFMNGAKIFMFDFKGGVEFGKRYERFGEVVTERKRAIEVLQILKEENEKRLKLFRELEVKNLPEYNQKTGKNLCRIGVFCDEIAEMMDKKGACKEDKEDMEKLEGLISSLARLSRATGINLFLGVQRPDANVLTGQIKNNVPVRICGRFADKPASEIVLGNTDAVCLPDIKGRFLFRLGNVTEEFQAYYFDDDIHLHDNVPKTGQMLSEMEQDLEEQDSIPFEGLDDKELTKYSYSQEKLEFEEKETHTRAFAELRKEEQEEVKNDEMKKFSKGTKKLKEEQEEFSFTWSCEESEGKENDV